MAKKNQPLDYFKLWPIVVVLVSMVGGFYTMKAQADQQDKRLGKAEENIETVEQSTNNVLVNQAKQQVALDLILEYVKEIKSKK